MTNPTFRRFFFVLLGASALVGCTNSGGGGGTMDTGDDVASIDDAASTDDASAADVDPNFLPDGAPNPCLGASSCDECTGRTPCGWCNGHCLAGGASGSYDGTCSGAAWQYYGDQCSAGSSQCPMHTDCNSCAMDENGCGWCTNTHQCMSGGSHGPSTAVGGCDPSAGTWIYNTTMMMCP